MGIFNICCLYDFNYLDITNEPGATIYVDINGMTFPDNQWYDLPVSVLDMWCWNLIENSKFLTAEFSLCFMDGPYFIKCLKDDSIVKMQFIDNHTDNEKILMEYIATFNELTNVICESANELISTLANHKVEKSPTLLSLKRKANKVKKLKRRQKNGSPVSNDGANDDNP